MTRPTEPQVGAPASSPARRVLHLIESWGPGGAERVLTDVVAGLDRNVWASVVAPIAEGWVSEQARRHDATVAVVPQHRRFDTEYLATLCQLIRRERIAIVHAHLLMSSLYGGMAARWTGIPALATFHGTVDVPRGSAMTSVKAAILRQTITRTIFVSHALRDDIAPRLGLPADRVGVIYNGVDPDRFTPGTSRHWRDVFAIGDHEFVIGAVGNIRPSKGYDVLLRAVASLRDAGVAIRCLVAGNAGWGETQATVDALMRELRLEQTVHFCGFVEDSAAFLRSVDGYVLSSRTEGFSISTLEAMATGLPVVATRCGGPEEIISDRVDGLLVAVNDPTALADGIRMLIADPVQRRRVAQAARGTVLDRFSSRRNAAAYAQAYTQLLARTSPR